MESVEGQDARNLQQRILVIYKRSTGECVKSMTEDANNSMQRTALRAAADTERSRRYAARSDARQPFDAVNSHIRA